MNLNPLRIFLAIVDTGSQRGAARALGLTQPAITKALQRLEAELDVRLFERSVHGAALTEYGEVLLGHARLIEFEVKTCVEALDQLKGAHKGSVSIALSHLPGTLLLPKVLRGFRRNWPEVNLRIAAGAYPFLLTQVRQGALDFAVAPAPAQNWPEDLVREPLMPTRLSAVVRRGHPFAGATRLAELIGAEWIVPTQESATAQALIAAMRDQGLPRPVCRVTCETFTGLTMSVASGDLIGLIPSEMVGSIAGFADVMELRITDRLDGAELCLIRRRTSVLTPAAAALATSLANAAKRLASTAPARGDDNKL